jgi:hypothetical protein
MKLAIMQPYFFPYVCYFQLINAVDKFLLYENVAFRKKGWMTRNYILPKNGKLLSISIPVVARSSFRQILDLKISEYRKWGNALLRKIYFAYKHALYFDETMALLKQCIDPDYSKLHEFNSTSIVKICTHLNIPTTITTDHSCYLELESELSRTFDVLHHHVEEDAQNLLDKKNARVIAICKKEGASIYYNAINGRSLYKKEDFAKEQISLSFIKTNGINYKQFHSPFMPNLSIIDVLMHCGKEKTKQLMDEYDII